MVNLVYTVAYKTLFSNGHLCRQYIFLSNAVLSVWHWQEMAEKVSCPPTPYILSQSPLLQMLEKSKLKPLCHMAVFQCFLLQNLFLFYLRIEGHVWSLLITPQTFLISVEIAAYDHRLCVIATEVTLATQLIYICKEK